MLDKAGKQAEAQVKANEALNYMPGFGNDFETESLPGALPQGQNSPQKCALAMPSASSRASTSRPFCSMLYGPWLTSEAP